jgi:hypothetical protein
VISLVVPAPSRPCSSQTKPRRNHLRKKWSFDSAWLAVLVSGTAGQCNVLMRSNAHHYPVNYSTHNPMSRLAPFVVYQNNRLNRLKLSHIFPKLKSRKLSGTQSIGYPTRLQQAHFTVANELCPPVVPNCDFPGAMGSASADFRSQSTILNHK